MKKQRFGGLLRASMLPFVMGCMIVVLAACTPPQQTVRPPIIETIRPAHMDVGVHVGQNIVIHFEDTVDEDWLAHHRVSFEPAIECHFVWHPEEHSLTCEPLEDLVPDTTYEVLVDGLVVSHESEFTTHASAEDRSVQRIVASEPKDGWWDVRDDVDTLRLTFAQPVNTGEVESQLLDGALQVAASSGDWSDVACHTFTWNLSATEVTCTHATSEGDHRLFLDLDVVTSPATATRPPNLTREEREIRWNVVPLDPFLGTSFRGPGGSAVPREGDVQLTVSFEEVLDDDSLSLRAQAYDNRGVPILDQDGGLPVLVFDVDSRRSGGSATLSFVNQEGCTFELQFRLRVTSVVGLISTRQGAGCQEDSSGWFTMFPVRPYVDLSSH